MSQYDGPPEPYGSPPNQQPGGYPGPDYGRAPGAGMPDPASSQQSGPSYGPQYGYAGPLVAAAPAGTHIDPSTGVVIPNGTEVASAGRRIGAFFLYIVLLIATLGIGYVIWGLVEWSNGRTPVQRVLGLRCYKNNEFRVLGWGDMFLRQFILWACGIIWPVQIANFIVFLVNGKRQGLHDMASNCIVLHDPKKVLG